jgi:hypothetical protein
VEPVAQVDGELIDEVPSAVIMDWVEPSALNVKVPVSRKLSALVYKGQLARVVPDGPQSRVAGSFQTPTTEPPQGLNASQLVLAVELPPVPTAPPIPLLPPTPPKPRLLLWTRMGNG